MKNKDKTHCTEVTNSLATIRVFRSAVVALARLVPGLDIGNGVQETRALRNQESVIRILGKPIVNEVTSLPVKIPV